MYSCGTSKLPCKNSWWDTFVVNEGVGIMISFVARSVSFAEWLNFDVLRLLTNVK